MDGHAHHSAGSQPRGDGKKAARDRSPRPGVLVVDDEPGVLALLREVLQREGYPVWLAASGDEAVTTYRRQQDQIRLVLLDVRMAGLDGPQTLAELRRLNPALRCCFMSGHTGRYTEEQLLQAGAWGVARKPFRLADLLTLVEKAVDGTGSV